MEGEGLSIVDAEKIVELNLTKIVEKLHELGQTSCSSATTSAEVASRKKHCNSRAEVLRPSGVEGREDIGGDMNHIHRVTIQLVCSENAGTSDGSSTECQTTVATVIVKTAPDEVLYLKKEYAEKVDVDQNKIEFEYSSIIKFMTIQTRSVPDVFLLDRPHKTIVMEDLSRSGFTKLQDVLVSGDVSRHQLQAAVGGALTFIGRVHSETWLEKLTSDEKGVLISNHSNSVMRRLMSELLFDRPFSSEERSNTVNPLLSHEVRQIRCDKEVLSQVTKLKRDFLQQDDCLCHGDLAIDNIMVNNEGEFKIIDLEFSGIGLHAYDLALFLEMTIFWLLYSHHSGQMDRSRSLYSTVNNAVKAYELGVGAERARDPLFVEQTCGLIAMELMWMVFGSYNIVEFSGDPAPERVMLSMARNLLLKVDPRQTVVWNINHQLSLQNLNIES